MKYRGILSPASRLHEELDEPSEQIVRIMRSRSGLRVVLDCEDRQAPVPHALARAIVEVDVGDLEPGGRARVRIDGEAVILRRDLDAPGPEVLYRMVRAVVAEGQLERPRPEG